MGVDRTHPSWRVYRDEAARYAKEHGEDLTEDQLSQRADVAQIMDAARARRFESLIHDSKLSILDAFEKLALESGMPRLRVNTLRGNLSEALFNPQRGPKPVYLLRVRIASAQLGSTIPDYSIPHEEFVEWVEQKSDLIASGPKRADGATEAGVGAARKYRADAIADEENLPVGDKISIEFVRNVDPATKKAMLDVLFSPESPVYRVRFGGGEWIPRSAPSGAPAIPTAGPR